jgi:hypothetical protein
MSVLTQQRGDCLGNRLPAGIHEILLCGSKKRWNGVIVGILDAFLVLRRFQDVLARMLVQFRGEMGTCMIFRDPDSTLRIMVRNEQHIGFP